MTSNKKTLLQNEKILFSNLERTLIGMAAYSTASGTSTLVNTLQELMMFYSGVNATGTGNIQVNFHIILFKDDLIKLNLF
jgi:hypothetical protein